MKLTFIYLLLITFIIGCSKDKDQDKQTLPIDNPCIPQENGPTIPDYQGAGWGFQIVQLDSFQFNNPYVNPNNENEFVYFVYDFKFISSGIYTYNIVTKQKNLVLETDTRAKKNYPQSQIKWSRKGWLIFADYYQNIYKIKPDGDSLTLLISNGSNFLPEWNYQGTQFCIEHIATNNKRYTLICDENGNSQDSLQYKESDIFGGPIDWNHNQYILGTSNEKIILYDYINRKIDEIIAPSGNMSFLKWVNNNEFIYKGERGLYTFNITNNQVKQIRKTKNSNFYYDFNVLSNNQIICERNKRVLLDSFKQILGYKTSICILNPCDTIVTDFDLR